MAFSFEIVTSIVTFISEIVTSIVASWYRGSMAPKAPRNFFGSGMGGSDISFQVLKYLKCFLDFFRGGWRLESKKTSIGGIKVVF